MNKGVCTVQGQQRYQWTDIVRNPIFPGRSILLFKCPLTDVPKGNHEILYFITSRFGYFPGSLKKDQGGNPVKGLGNLTIVV